MCDCWADLPSEVEWNLGTWLLRGWSPRGYLHLWSPVQFNMDTFPMSYCFVIKGNTFPQSFPNHLVLLNFSTCNSSCETFSAVTWGDRTLGGAFLNTGNQDMVLLPEMSLSGEVKTFGVSKFRPHKELDSNQINFWMPVYFRILLTHPHVKIPDFVVLLELNGHWVIHHTHLRPQRVTRRCTTQSTKPQKYFDATWEVLAV